MTNEYYEENSEERKIRLKGYKTIASQYEIDYMDGILFYDHIDASNPWAFRQTCRLLNKRQNENSSWDSAGVFECLYC
ncbi:peptide deformylase [Lactovum odontotermitis]